MNMFINDKHNENHFTEIRKEIFKEYVPLCVENTSKIVYKFDI